MNLTARILGVAAVVGLAFVVGTQTAKEPPPPVPAQPLALVGEFAAVLNAPDVEMYYTPRGGFYAKSDSAAMEWQMRPLVSSARPTQRVNITQSIEQGAQGLWFELAPEDTLEVNLPQGRWFVGVTDTAYGESGFLALDSDPDGTWTCFDPAPQPPEGTPTTPIYSYISSVYLPLTFPERRVEWLYRNSVQVSVLYNTAYFRFAAYDTATKSHTNYGGLLKLVPSNEAPPPPPPPSGDGPDLTRAWWANGWTLRFAFEDSLGSETSAIDPATVDPSDFALTHNGNAVNVGALSYHWGWYFSTGGAQASGPWKLKVLASSVADTLGVFNSSPDSVEWIEP